MSELDGLTVLVHTAEGEIYIPSVLDGLAIETFRKGQPGKLSFKAVQDEPLKIAEGCIVQVKRGGKRLFQGVVFARELDKDDIISVVCYDQLRYLKNRHVYSAVGEKASDIIKQLAEDFQLECGNIADTGYVIPRFRAGDGTLFDTMQTALDITTQATGELFVLYDDCGKLCVKNIADMAVDILVDGETAGNFAYKSDIDRDTYNRVKLYFDNKETGLREVWEAEDSDTISRWGLLQLTESVNPKKATSLPDKAQALLKKHNRVRQTLTIRDAFGDDRVRGGSSLYVSLRIDGKDVRMRMLAESVRHTFANGEHFMDLSLRGGVFE